MVNRDKIPQTFEKVQHGSTRFESLPRTASNYANRANGGERSSQYLRSCAGEHVAPARRDEVDTRGGAHAGRLEARELGGSETVVAYGTAGGANAEHDFVEGRGDMHQQRDSLPVTWEG